MNGPGVVKMSAKVGHALVFLIIYRRRLGERCMAGGKLWKSLSLVRFLREGKRR